LAARLKLKAKPSDYFYLNQTGVLSDKAINDTGDWQRVLAAMNTMGFSEQERHDVLSVLAAILHLGNLTFTQNGGAQVRPALYEPDSITGGSRLV
jgi:myosin heavy subunit